MHDAFDDLPVGVYSGLRVYDGVRLLRLDLHIARTRRCLRDLGWPDLDEVGLRSALHELCSAYGRPSARLRFTALAAPVQRGGGEGRTMIAISPLEAAREEITREGVRVEFVPELRRDRPEIKTTDFVVERRPYPLGTQEAWEHLMLDGEGRILEGTSSNFFGLRKGVLITAGEGVLDGVTRHIVLELASALGLETRMEAIPASEVGDLDEAFQTSSSRTLVPIVNVAGTPLGDGTPGPVFRRLLEAYAAYAEREARPATE